MRVCACNEHIKDTIYGFAHVKVADSTTPMDNIGVAAAKMSFVHFKGNK